jgi:hypothetical protein
VLDAPASRGLVRNLPYEHQRREVDDLLLLLLREVQQDGDRQAGEREREERREKGHEGYLLLDFLARALRNLNST